MTRTEKLSSVQTGVAGEYFVAAELSRRGYVASLTLRNTRGIDLLVSNTDATKSVGIQVKTSQGTRPDWILSAKAEVDVAENLFYVFVCLPALGEPSYYIVPRATVAERVKKEHDAWRPTHGPSNIRKFRDPEGTYKDRWDDLGLSEKEQS
jgi:hypothetical protein